MHVDAIQKTSSKVFTYLQCSCFVHLLQCIEWKLQGCGAPLSGCGAARCIVTEKLATANIRDTDTRADGTLTSTVSLLTVLGGIRNASRRTNYYDINSNSTPLLCLPDVGHQTLPRRAHQCPPHPDLPGSPQRASSSCRPTSSKASIPSRNMTGQTAPTRPAGAISHVAVPRRAPFTRWAARWTRASSQLWAP